MLHLKKEAKERETSVNMLILKILEESTCPPSKTRKKRYHDLDELAGSWSPEEGQAFMKNTQLFEKIDEELWTCSS